MCYDISTTEKRVVIANVKTYETAGSYFTLKLSKKEAQIIGYRLNQKITSTLLELEQVSSQFDKIRDQTETKTLTNSKKKEKVTKKKLVRKPQKHYQRSKSPKQNPRSRILKLNTKSFISKIKNNLRIKLSTSVMDGGSNVRAITGIFPKILKTISFFILKEEPALDTSQFLTFAYSFHEDPSEFCKKGCPHYHLLIEKQNVKEQPQLSSLSSFKVPCLFTCF